MAYVGEPFAHDLFVSYSHGDADGTGASRLRQWSQGFARELESELRAFPQFGRDLRIFLDGDHRPASGVDPLEPLTEQLQAEIGRAAILVLLMSPHYLASTWCAAERDWWCDRQRALQLPHDGRIAVVRMWKTDASWPAALVDERGEPLVGFCFYDLKLAETRPQPYGWPEPGPQTGDPFRGQLLDLVGRIGLKLDDVRKRLEERREAQAQAARLGAAAGQVVYLHGRADHAAAWDHTANELAKRQMVILPGEPDPVVNDPQALQEIRRRRVETMSGCDALLLVGGPDPRSVDADLVVVGRQDRNSACAISNHVLPCALLDGIGDALRTERRRVAARSLNVAWIDATQPTWPPAVQEWLADTAQREANG